jgi:ABC-type multidrug transport system permease subunit
VSAAGAATATGRIRHQARVLVERYGACLAGDWLTVALLLAQAPIIGWLCTLVWGSIERDTPSLYFVMALAAVWFGCMNACREIVKERAIFERERLFGLSPAAYVVSKLGVLAMLGLAQALMLQMTIEWQLALRGAFVLHTLALWGASLCGVGLGLLVSALASTQERAVGTVPLLLLPQILFSKFVMPAEYFSDTAAALEKMMPVHWSFNVFEEAAATTPDWGRLALSLVVPFVYALVLAALAGVALLRRKEI